MPNTPKLHHPMFVCPTCGAQNSLDVINSRHNPDGIYRRRQCSKCGDRFTTQETYTGTAFTELQVQRQRVSRLSPDIDEVYTTAG